MLLTSNIVISIIFFLIVSEPSKARLQRPKHHRMSPIPKRNESALTKTLSVGGLGNQHLSN